MDTPENPAPHNVTAAQIAATRALIAEKWKAFPLPNYLSPQQHENLTTLLENQVNFHFPEAGVPDPAYLGSMAFPTTRVTKHLVDPQPGLAPPTE
jgi:hypothetical protein